MIAPAIHFLIAVFIHSICHPQTCTCFTVSDTTRCSHICAHEHGVCVTYTDLKALDELSELIQRGALSKKA